MKKIIAALFLLTSFASYSQIIFYGELGSTSFGLGTRSEKKLDQFIKGTTSAWTNTEGNVCVKGQVTTTKKAAQKNKWAFDISDCKQVGDETILIGNLSVVARYDMFENGQTTTAFSRYNTVRCASVSKIKKTASCNATKLMVNGHQLSL